MPRYIDAIEAEAAIQDLFPGMPRIEFNGNRRRWREENDPYLRCLDLLRSIPTADVVPKDKIDFITNVLTKRISERLIKVLEENYEITPKKATVCCKDCKWYEETDARIGTCLLVERGAEINGFCAWGERREDE